MLEHIKPDFFYFATTTTTDLLAVLDFWFLTYSSERRKIPSETQEIVKYFHFGFLTPNWIIFPPLKRPRPVSLLNEKLLQPNWIRFPQAKNNESLALLLSCNIQASMQARTYYD